MSEILTKKLALFGILWGSFASCAPISSALFDPRKCSIMGMGLFGKQRLKRRKGPVEVPVVDN
jgi:hypothetical protein